MTVSAASVLVAGPDSGSALLEEVLCLKTDGDSSEANHERASRSPQLVPQRNSGEAAAKQVPADVLFFSNLFCLSSRNHVLLLFHAGVIV